MGSWICTIHPPAISTGFCIAFCIVILSWQVFEDPWSSQFFSLAQGAIILLSHGFAVSRLVGREHMPELTLSMDSMYPFVIGSGNFWSTDCDSPWVWWVGSVYEAQDKVVKKGYNNTFVTLCCVGFISGNIKTHLNFQDWECAGSWNPSWKTRIRLFYSRSHSVRLTGLIRLSEWEWWQIMWLMMKCVDWWKNWCFCCCFLHEYIS